MDNKTCKTCSQTLPVGDFYLDSRTKSPMAVCKACHKARCKANYDNERSRAYGRSRPPSERTEADRAANREAQRRYRAANKEKVYVREVTRAVVRRGVIRKPAACEICRGGTREHPATLEAHHPDYARPYFFVWCHAGSCHEHLHTGEREIPPFAYKTALEREAKLLERLHRTHGRCARHRRWVAARNRDPHLQALT